MNKEIEVVIILGTSQFSPQIKGHIEVIRNLFECRGRDYKISFIDFQDVMEEENHFELDNYYNHWMMFILECHDVIILLTPVNSYYLSPITEAFMKQMAYVHQLEIKNNREPRCKNIVAISSSEDEFIGHNFFEPFKTFAENVNMNFLGELSICRKNSSDAELELFLKSIPDLISIEGDKFDNRIDHK